METPPANSLKTELRSRWRLWLSLVIALTLVLTLVYAGLSRVVGSIRSVECGNCLKQIGIALRAYHIQYATFPPAFSCDENGQRLNSWRTIIVPGRISYTFSPTYDFSAPWNSPGNIRLRQQGAADAGVFFHCPSASGSSTELTNYVAIVGAETMWSGSEPTAAAGDGSDDDKILVIEIINSDIEWAEPRDLTLDEALDLTRRTNRVGSGHTEGIHYLTVGGEVRTLSPDIDRESLRRLIVRGDKTTGNSDDWRTVPVR